MLFFSELKKIIKNKALVGLTLVLLAAVAVSGARAAASAEYRSADARELSEAYELFVNETESAAKTAMRMARGEYAVSYYTEVIERYRAAGERIVFDSGDISGWDELLCFDLPFYAALIIAVMAGAVSFFEDTRKGTSQIIIATRNGRRTLAISRILSAVVFSVLFCVLSGLIVLACFGAMGLLHNGSFALQCAPSFLQSAEDLSLARTFVLLTLRRCLICAAVCAIACLVSKILKGYIAIILVSAAFPVLQFVLFSVRYSAVDVFVKNANIFAYGTAYLFKRFYCVRFFGKAYPEDLVLIFAIAVIVVFFALSVLLLEQRRQGGVRRIKLPFDLSRTRSKARPHGLFSWEFVKLLRTPEIILPVCLCLIIGIAGVIRSGPVKANTGETVYRAYCEEFSGMPARAAYDTILEEEMRVEAGIGQMEAAESLFIAGKITVEEYEKITKEFIDCYIKQGQILTLKARAKDLVDTSAELGCDLELVYDTGYNKFLSKDVNFPAFLAVILLACACFYKEREGEVFPVFRASRNGRKRLFLTRALFAVVCAVVVFALFTAAELYAVSGNGIFDYLRVPAASLERLKVFGTQTIGSVIFQMYAMRLISAVCAALITFSLSVCFDSIFLVLAPVCGWALISFALRRFGMVFLPADLSAFLSGGALISEGASACLMMLPLLIITGILAVYSYKKYTYSGRRIS